MAINPVAIAFIILLVMLFMKFPVFVALMAGAASYFILDPSVTSMIVAQKFISGAESLSLMAIPFFIFAGILMNYSGIIGRIMDLCELITGRMHGGLAQVNVLLSTLMGGLSGSSLADAAMDAKMLVPEMERKGYSKPFASVVTAVSSLITPLIPPGIGMIVYGTIANVSIGKLFVAGLGIGIVFCILQMILVSVISRKRGYGIIRKEKLQKGEVWRIVKRAILPLCLPVIIIGGIRIGIFTATEAGAVAVIYAAILGLIYKELNWKKLVQAIKETALPTASVMIIVASASVFAWVLTKENVSQNLTAFALSLVHSKFMFLFIVNIFLLLAGMFIEGNAIMLVLVPLLAPVAASYGVGEINFAMMFIFNMAVGSITPPLGTCMYVTCGITKCPTTDFIKESIPWYIVMFIMLLLITYVPFVSEGLVSLIY